MALTKFERRLKHAIQEAEKMAADIRKNGTAGYQTLDDLIAELRAEDNE